jgi:hypothetical protein
MCLRKILNSLPFGPLRRTPLTYMTTPTMPFRLRQLCASPLLRSSSQKEFSGTTVCFQAPKRASRIMIIRISHDDFHSVSLSPDLVMPSQPPPRSSISSSTAPAPPATLSSLALNFPPSAYTCNCFAPGASPPSRTHSWKASGNARTY